MATTIKQASANARRPLMSENASLFRPERMHRVKIYAMKKNRTEVMHEIQKAGVMHICETNAPLAETPSAEEAEIIHDAVKNTEKIEKMKSLFPEKRGLGSFFEEPSTPVSLVGYTDSAFRFWSNKCVTRLYSEFEQIISLEKQNIKKIGGAEKTKSMLLHFESLAIPLESLGNGKYIYSGLGKLKTGASEIPKEFFVQIYDTTEDGETYVFFSVPKELKDIVQKYIAVVELKETGIVKNVIREQQRIISEAGKESGIIAEKKKCFEKNKPLILALEEKWNNIKTRESACKEMRETGCTFSIEGWVPESSLEKVTSMKNAVVYSCEEKESAPTKLKNPKIFRPFEMITTNYGFPKYGEMDPTIFTAVAFIVFFGFMFMDIAYSLMLIPFSVVFIKKGRKEIKDIGHLFLLGSVSGIVFGLLGGSFLGNFITFDSYLDAYKKPFALIFYALIIGTIHINLGIGAKLYESHRKKDFAGVKDAISWFSLEAGALLLAFSATLSKSLLIPATLCVAWSLSVRLKDGFYGMISAIDFFGNILSYIRLMALALLTSWIAFVINLLSGLIAGFSVWAAAAFFSLGHFVNLILNVVSSSMHSLRLNYVEFFGTFYEGGGTEYKPLMLRNEHHKPL